MPARETSGGGAGAYMEGDGSSPALPDPSAPLPHASGDAPAASDQEAHGLPRYGYWIGRGHTRTIRAAGEDEARDAILARHPHARRQRLTIERFTSD